MDLSQIPVSNPLQQRILELVSDEARARLGHEPLSPLDLVHDAVALEAALADTTAAIVAAVRVDGYTWQEVSFEAGLRSAQAAYYRWGTNAELIDAAAELNPQPAALATPAGNQAPREYAPALPGVSLAEAARILKLNPRTVKRRGEQGLIETVEATQLSGRVLTRYLLSEELEGAGAE